MRFSDECCCCVLLMLLCFADLMIALFAMFMPTRGVSVYYMGSHRSVLKGGNPVAI
jgi:hypothetical protein